MTDQNIHIIKRRTYFTVPRRFSRYHKYTKKVIKVIEIMNFFNEKNFFSYLWCRKKRKLFAHIVKYVLHFIAWKFGCSSAYAGLFYLAQNSCWSVVRLRYKTETTHNVMGVSYSIDIAAIVKRFQEFPHVSSNSYTLIGWTAIFKFSVYSERNSAWKIRKRFMIKKL